MATNNDRDLDAADKYAAQEVSDYESKRQHDVVQRAFLKGCEHARAEMQAKLAREREKSKVLAEALFRLRNEVRGTLSAHELAIRYDSGNTNWQCLEIVLDKASELLAKYAEEEK